MLGSIKMRGEAMQGREESESMLGIKKKRGAMLGTEQNSGAMLKTEERDRR